ncbi:hypothetical protein ROTO_02030 [Roseovarius tolerans]|uniref:Uncharacterized protein n=1 Tax=Roseovarius tolerans TaxID=74031 RepID=A0A0L6CX07_9RHOB|nr:hypothetical protein ROTO_11910 [Roseovarius tolerans]KNX43413.1 hypothetical protein ROTO_02030 [Roseovarius tolerans]
MRLQGTEQRGALARPVGQDLRDQATIVVIKDGVRDAAEEGKGVDVAIHPRLRRRRGIGPHKAGVAVRQIQDEEMGLLLDAIDDHHGFAEIRLGIPGRVGERHEHLTSTPLAVPDIVLDDRVAAGETVLLAQPVIYPLGGMALLAVGLTIPVQPRVDNLGEPVQLRALDRLLAPVTGRR